MNYILYRLILGLTGFISLQAGAQQIMAPAASHNGSAIVVLTGKITDAKSGEPLVGATIYFPDLRTGTSADRQGMYKIQNIPQGKYLLEVSYTGYTSHVE